MLPRRISVSLFIDQSIIWPVKRLQAFKFQLRPGGQQEREMRRFAGACRFVFNRALALQNENHEAGNKYIPYGKMASWLVEWKNATETQWLKDSPSQPLQQSLKDLERAYKNFFQKRAAFTRRALSSIRKTAVFFCRNWAGCATGTAVRSRVL